MGSIGHMVLTSSSWPNPNPIRPGTSSFQSQILFFVKSLEEAWKRKREAEAEAVEGRLEEAEAKEKLTAVPSLVRRQKGRGSGRNVIWWLKSSDGTAVNFSFASAFASSSLPSTASASASASCFCFHASSKLLKKIRKRWCPWSDWIWIGLRTWLIDHMSNWAHTFWF